MSPALNDHDDDLEAGESTLLNGDANVPEQPVSVMHYLHS